MSALPQKADMLIVGINVCLCHKQTFERRREGPRADVGFVISMR